VTGGGGEEVREIFARRDLEGLSGFAVVITSEFAQHRRMLTLPGREETQSKKRCGEKNLGGMKKRLGYSPRNNVETARRLKG